MLNSNTCSQNLQAENVMQNRRSSRQVSCFSASAQLLIYVPGVKERYIEDALNKTGGLAMGEQIFLQNIGEGAVKVLY